MTGSGTQKRRELDDIGLYIKARSCGGSIVQDVLDVKGNDVVTISPEAPMREALALMSKHNIGVLVAVEEEEVVGIISERDFAREEVFGRRDWEDNQVHRLMKSPVQTVSPNDSVMECLSLMTMGRVRHLPVKAGGKLVGLVSIGDLVKDFIAGRDNLIRQYDEYIRGTM
jgi:CBS domain-containing protein